MPNETDVRRPLSESPRAMFDSIEDLDLLDDSELIERHSDGKTTVRLREPIEHKKDVIRELVIRPIKAGHLRVMDDVKGDVAKQLRLMSELSGVSITAINQLSGADFSTVNRVMEGYLGKSQGTGKTS